METFTLFTLDAGDGEDVDSFIKRHDDFSATVAAQVSSLQ